MGRVTRSILLRTHFIRYFDLVSKTICYGVEVINSRTMYFDFVLFYYIIGIIYFVETADPDVQSLLEIGPDEAAPLVLFKLGVNNELVLPTILSKPLFKDGKMIHGTQFMYRMKTDQMFFCPNTNDKTKQCLIQKKFEGDERLRCPSEAPLIIDSVNLQCGDDEYDTLYKTFYEICDSEVKEFEFSTSEINFYHICYNKYKEKTLFTIHIIISPELLREKFLVKERELNYRMMKVDEFPEFSTIIPDSMDTDDEPPSQYQTTKAGYQWRKLVPSEDMALGLWRKTTFQETNLALQHEQLIHLWDKISSNIRSRAIRSLTNDKLKTFVYTGVFDPNSAHEINEDGQLSDVWVKLVMTVPFAADEISKANYGLAILMNNFVDIDTSSTTSSNLKIFQEYCGDNLCTDDLSNEFQQIKGHVHCCIVTKELLNLFYEKFARFNVPELQIPNVNVTEDQEIFYDNYKDLLTDEEAGRRICEIQPNEILPIIMMLNPNNLKLYVPRSILQIQTKNRRIVNGSEFYYENSHRQIIFCPSEDPDKKCYAPRTFGRFEPLQCARQLAPIVRQLKVDPNNPNSNKCGVGNKGTLHEVVYEFCPMEQPFQYVTTELKLYELCYDTKRKLILYTRHKIMSANILNSRLLQWERKLEYEMMADPTLPLANFEQLVAANQTEKKSTSKLQKLVPSEDMAFGLWRKSTYQFYNTALQHKSLIKLWNAVNICFKENAFTKLTISGTKYYHFENSVYTGVIYDQSSSSRNTGQPKPKIWFKVVHSESLQYKAGIVILMYNSIISKATRSTSTIFDKHPLDEYCDENIICVRSFEREFEKVGSRVRCCPWNIEIARKLGIPDRNIHFGGEMPIRMITYSED